MQSNIKNISMVFLLCSGVVKGALVLMQYRFYQQIYFNVN